MKKEVSKPDKIEINPNPPLVTYSGTKTEKMQALLNDWGTCTRCPYGQARSAKGVPEIVFGDGNLDAKIMIVGEAPGEEEERCFFPFVGQSGKLLNTILASTTLDKEIQELHQWYVEGPRRGATASSYEERFHNTMIEWRTKNFYVSNALGCRPPTDGVPAFPLVMQCWERLWNIIYIVDPIVIVSCGNTGLSAVMRKSQVKITAMRGKVYDVTYKGLVGDLVYPIVPTFHPAYLLRKADWNLQGGDYSKTLDDWKMIMRMVNFLEEP